MLFNTAKEQFDNDDLGIYRIKHYPFRTYNIGLPPL